MPCILQPGSIRWLRSLLRSERQAAAAPDAATSVATGAVSPTTCSAIVALPAAAPLTTSPARRWRGSGTKPNGSRIHRCCSIHSPCARPQIGRNTASRWRHRFLHWVKLDRPALLNGIVETDETFLLESQKGSRTLDRPPRHRGGHAVKRDISSELDCILVARDREGRTVDAVTGRGALKTAQLERDLLPRLDRQALLISDGHPAYRAFARKHRIAHDAVNVRAGVRVRRMGSLAIHVQNVNAYQQRFKAWLQGFRGVASRYLSNSLGWRSALDGERVTSPEQLLSIAISVINR
jgi:hypothetical protein